MRMICKRYQALSGDLLTLGLSNIQRNVLSWQATAALLRVALLVLSGRVVHV